MVPMRVQKRKEAFHEPCPLNPSFSPSGGEGARRAVEGIATGSWLRFMSGFWRCPLPMNPDEHPTSNIQHPTSNDRQTTEHLPSTPLRMSAMMTA